MRVKILNAYKLFSIVPGTWYCSTGTSFYFYYCEILLSMPLKRNTENNMQGRGLRETFDKSVVHILVGLLLVLKILRICQW